MISAITLMMLCAPGLLAENPRQDEPPSAVSDADIATARRVRHHLLADRDRPTYHFVAPEGAAVPFDPNGAIFWKGRYHLFYIYQERGVHQFGHVSSLDMLRWRHHPPAIMPTPDSPETGIFSGNCFVDAQGRAVMFYHGIDAGNCIATSTDDLLERWTKLPANPVMPFPPPGAPYRPWDPHGWREGNAYYAICGGERPALFKASTIDRWSYVGDFMHHKVAGIDGPEDKDVSCPDFFTLGGKRVLVCISHNRGARYFVGDWKEEQFHPETHARMSWSDNTYFATESLEAPDGRRVQWAWIFDQRPEATRLASGWSGEMALPRELTLGDDNLLRIKPLDELKTLRYDERTFGPFDLASDADQVLEGISGDTVELLVEIDRQDAGKVGVVVRRSPDGKDGTRVAIDFAGKALAIGAEAGPFEARGDVVTLRIFLDRSIVEAFADDRQAVLRHVYPANPESLGISLFATGGAAKIRKVTSWKMFPANPH